MSLRKHTKAVGWAPKLYDLPTFNRATVDFETLLFRKIDQRASDLFEKLAKHPDPKLTRTETEVLAVFLLTLLHRSPAGIAAMRQLSRLLFEEVKREMRGRYHELRKDDDPATVEEYEAALPRDAYLDHFSDLFRTVVLSERVATHFANLHWKRVRLEVPDRRLLLSDDPLIRTDGLAGPEGHVAFPLTPTLAIIGCNDPRYFDRIFALNPRTLIASMNIQSVESARHFVVDLDERQSTFVKNRFGANPRPTVSEASLQRRASAPE